MEHDNSTFINCKTALGKFFGEISNENEIFSSAIESKICFNCKITKGKIVPFISIDVRNMDVKNIQKSVDSYN